LNEKVYIDTPRKSLSDALSIHIQQQLGFNCLRNYEHVLKGLDDQNDEDRTLYLIDCSGARDSDLKDRIKRESVVKNNQDYMALFNVAINIADDIEMEALARGYRGVFFENVSLEMLMKGIRAIFEGQVWFSRNILNLFYEKVREAIAGPSQKKDIDLTSREKEILTLITAGCHNSEIGEKLYISKHTVKTHIYNLFKKIDVPNRFQAALWGASHNLKE
jgi:LuxR family transcriptional regulator, positive regulator of biofilm formation